MSQYTNQSFIYNFLINPKLRIWRHILLIAAFIIMSLNLTFSTYREIMPELGNNIVILFLITFISYYIFIYLNIYIFAPRYLITGKYLKYSLTMLLEVFIFLLFQDIVKFTVFVFFNKTFIINGMIIGGHLSDFFAIFICLYGISIPLFLKNRMENSRRIDQLENNKLFTEVELLKEQVNYSFLLNILSYMSQLVKTEPKKASDMLMKLSHLLRYQLYDCNRDKVLLNSEITFIRNYLQLEQLYESRFEYEVITKGDFSKVLIPPLLFLPFIQSTIKSISENDIKRIIKIQITIEQKEILLNCEVRNHINIISNTEYQQVKQRLDLLYKDAYLLTISNDAEIQNITLKLNNEQ